MAEYLTAFANHTQYETFTGTSAYILPNVSLCQQEEEVHYGPVPPPEITSVTVDSTSVAKYTGTGFVYSGETVYPYPYTGTSINRGLTGTWDHVIKIYGNDFHTATCELCDIARSYMGISVATASTLTSYVQNGNEITINVHMVKPADVTGGKGSSATCGLKISGLYNDGTDEFIFLSHYLTGAVAG